MLATGAPIEKDVQDRHGGWLLLRVLPYRSRSRLAGVVLTLIDISGLKRTEARLSQLSAIVECSNDAIIGLALDGRITAWNRGAEQLYGYRADEVLGRHISMLRQDGVDDPSQQEWTSDILERIETGLPADHQTEAVRRHKDGRMVQVLLSLSPIRDAGGSLCGMSVIARDNSKRKQAEEAILQYARDLETVNRDLQISIAAQRKAEEQSREAVRLRDRFLAILSHELRNPLAAIVNASMLLECENVEPHVLREACGAISRQSRQMTRLLDDLLDVSRITRNKIEIRKQRTDLCKTARDAVEAIRPSLGASQIDFQLNLPDEPVWVHGDPARLQQIQVNLLTNAIKYTPRGGSVWLSVTQQEGKAVLAVRDTGRGIPAAMQDKVFDLFVQLNCSPGKEDAGMGVGLSLVRALVELHEGEIDVRSEGEGKGSEFIVRLPVDTREPVTPDEITPAKNLSGLRVLLIEDQSDVRTVMNRLLEMVGCEVFSASDGAKGIEVIDQFKPNAALIDIGLPEMDGYEIARRIRGLPHGQGIRLIALTGFGQPSDKERAIEAGFDAHVVKPVSMQELTSVLGECLARVGG